MRERRGRGRSELFSRIMELKREAWKREQSVDEVPVKHEMAGNIRMIDM